MTQVWQAAAYVALLLLIGIGVSLILADQVFTGLSLLALAIPMQWMLGAPAHEGGYAQPVNSTQQADVLPWSALIAIGSAMLFLAIAFLTYP